MVNLHTSQLSSQLICWSTNKPDDLNLPIIITFMLPLLFAGWQNIMAVYNAQKSLAVTDFPPPPP